MMKIFVFFVASIIVLTGCSGERKEIASSTENEPRIKKLLSSTDRLVVKHFFDTVTVAAPKDFARGSCEFGPVIVYEPGKEGDRVKGLRVEISSEQSSASFLDLDEAKDLDAALSYMEQTEQNWKAKRPADDIEVIFTAKDDFAAVMFPVSGKLSGQTSNLPDMIDLSSGRIGGARMRVPVGSLGELHMKLRQAISTLEAN